MWLIKTTKSCNIMNLMVNQFEIYMWKVSMFLHCILRIESCGQFFFLACTAMPSLVGGPWHSYYPCYPVISKFCSNYNDRLSTNTTFMSTFCTPCVFAHMTNIFTKHIFKLIWHCLDHVLGEKLCQIIL